MSLTAISPVDGRYQSQTAPLQVYFSEFALMRYRVLVEIEYFIALCELPLPQLAAFPKAHYVALRDMYQQFSQEEAVHIKQIEKVTNHDVKAVEYFIKEKFDTLELSAYKEFIHFGLTSQDINNTAIPLSLLHAHQQVFVPQLQNFVQSLKQLISAWATIPMLARTHGQPASPTRLGKEIEVFAVRLQQQINLLQQLPFAAKFGGATGNFNAHHVAYPEINWQDFAQQFVEKTLGLHRSFPTTQIEHYDHLAAYCDTWKRINNILIDFARDVWHYISIEYFKQKIKANEVGSSAMPHKVNPIDFENAEGNLGVANALLEHFAAKLPISRLQRDLTDSTVLRNLGVPFAHILIAFNSLQKGIEKIELNEKALQLDLENNWAVVAEAIQTVLRREGYPNPYEALKDLTRKGEKIDQELIFKFISSLKISESLKNELEQITPFNYTGI
jgi:adenylosuccinate lyase